MPSLDGAPAAAARVFAIRNGWATGVASNGLGRSAGDPAVTSSAGVRQDRAARLRGGSGERGEGSRVGSVRWNVRTGETRVFGELEHGASTVNAHGWQVGTDPQGRAVLVTGAAPVVLPDLAGHDPGDPSIPTTLSDDGRTVAGQSNDATGTVQAVVWRCR
ncbi:hypothetical protein ABNF97_09160 [Plantactinospora sp. B6F1]|uniref:hypothetical protein n=1 Tax=Plantactinospora sp. B6F1 TaxID=3158971 RepID=UPI0032D95632